MCFFNSAEQAYLEQNESFYTLKVMTFSKYYFQKLLNSYREKNVLNAPASNTDGFLSRDTCVPST
jgi:hypothetical protein